MAGPVWDEGSVSGDVEVPTSSAPQHQSQQPRHHSNAPHHSRTQAYAVKANFEGADMTNAVVDRVDFTNANLKRVKFINTVVTGASVSRM